MPDVFISYKRSRRPTVERLASALQAHGWDVWFDARLTEGEQYRKEIESELANSRCAIVLWCEESIASDFVLDEAGWAKAQGVLIQARLAAVNPPLGFGQQQQVDIIGWERGIPALAKLIESLERMIGAPGSPTRNSMGRPTSQAKAAAAVGSAQTPVSSFETGIRPHLAIQLEQALRAAVAVHSKLGATQLHPQVRIAAEDARRTELAAINVQFAAMHNAELAEQAAARARLGDANTTATTYPAGDRYEGEVRDSKRSGFGLYRYNSGARHAGVFRNNIVEGPAVYTFPLSENSIRYEGDFENDKRRLGVHHFRSGTRYFGEEQSETFSGSGVYIWEDDRRYEGLWSSGKYHGAGVLWAADGAISKAGIWEAGALKTPLSK